MCFLVDLSGHCKDSSDVSVWYKIQSSQLVLAASFGCLDVEGWLGSTRICHFAMAIDADCKSTCSPVYDSVYIISLYRKLAADIK